MKVEYLFNTSGRWIAFKVGKYLFNTNGEWIGWFPWNGISVDINGTYLGTIYDRNRLLVDLRQPKITYPGYPGYPGHPGYPGYPGYIGYISYIPNTEDVNEERLRGK